jgi:fatty-acid desaturase
VGRQPLWMISVGHLAGLAGVVLGVWLIATGAASQWWLLAWAAFHLLGSLMLSVGLHRYFSHGSFKTTPFWHNFMALYSVLLLNGSPHGWAAAHNAHHAFSDTDRDPHIADWTYLVWKRYRSTPLVTRGLRRLAGDPVVAFVHRTGLWLWLAFTALLLWASPEAYLFAYLMPLGSVHLIGALHQVTSHKNLAPRDIWWLELVLPACGEWLHKTHHDHPGRSDFRTKWWHVDLGAALVRAISVNTKS